MASMLRHLLKIMSTPHDGLGSANGEGQGQRPRRALFDTVLRHGSEERMSTPIQGVDSPIPHARSWGLVGMGGPPECLLMLKKNSQGSFRVPQEFVFVLRGQLIEHFLNWILQI